MSLLDALREDSTPESALLGPLLEEFAVNFSSDPTIDHPLELSERLCSLFAAHASEWELIARVQVLQCIRVLMRGGSRHCELFVESGSLSVMSSMFAEGANHYYTSGRMSHDLECNLLTEAASIAKKLAKNSSSRRMLCESGVHNTLVLLLGTNDPLVLHSVLVALINLVSTSDPYFAEEVARLDCVETLVRIVQEYEVQFKALAAELLGMLSASHQAAREDTKIFQGHSAVLSVLHNTDDLELMNSLLFALTKIAIDPEALEEVRMLGGVPLLLSLLDPTSWHWAEGDEGLVVSVCTTVTQFALEVTTSEQIRHANGVFLLGRLVVSSAWKGPYAYSGDRDSGESKSAARSGNNDELESKRGADGDDDVEEEEEAKRADQRSRPAAAAGGRDVWCHAFRTLRVLFSAERNRRIFRGLFAPELYAAFIDVGHYELELAPYASLCRQRAAMGASALRRMASRF